MPTCVSWVCNTKAETETGNEISGSELSGVIIFAGFFGADVLDDRILVWWCWWCWWMLWDVVSTTYVAIHPVPVCCDERSSALESFDVCRRAAPVCCGD